MNPPVDPSPSAGITSDPASPAPAPTAPKAHRSVVNKAIQNAITEADVLFHTASTDPTIAPILHDHGYDEAEWADGDAKLVAAAAAFGVRLEKRGSSSNAFAGLATASDKAREDYVKFRGIARAAFPAQGDRVSLGLTGEVPADLDGFITAAHTSYVNAGKAPWAAKMTKRGYPAAKLTTLNAALDALTVDDADAAEAEGDAQDSTAKRDAAYQPLHDFAKELRGVCRSVFRKNPAALTKLKL